MFRELSFTYLIVFPPVPPLSFGVFVITNLFNYMYLNYRQLLYVAWHLVWMLIINASSSPLRYPERVLQLLVSFLLITPSPCSFNLKKVHHRMLLLVWPHIHFLQLAPGKRLRTKTMRLNLLRSYCKHIQNSVRRTFGSCTHHTVTLYESIAWNFLMVALLSWHQLDLPLDF